MTDHKISIGRAFIVIMLFLLCAFIEHHGTRIATAIETAGRCEK